MFLSLRNFNSIYNKNLLYIPYKNIIECLVTERYSNCQVLNQILVFESQKTPVISKLPALFHFKRKRMIYKTGIQNILYKGVWKIWHQWIQLSPQRIMEIVIELHLICTVAHFSDQKISNTWSIKVSWKRTLINVRIQQNLYTAIEWIWQSHLQNFMFFLTSALWENED